MAMTFDPKAKHMVYTLRFKRPGASEQVQRHTLNAAAVLCGDWKCAAEILSGKRVIGNMTPDGLIDWYE